MKKTYFHCSSIGTFALVPLIILWVNIGVFAQNNTVSPRTHKFQNIHLETGINIVPLMRTVANRGVDSLNQSPYLLNMRISWKKWGLRGSIGGAYHKRDNYVEGFKDSDITTSSQMHHRIGVDYKSNWRQHVTFSIGADWVGQILDRNRRIDSGFDVIEQVSHKYLNGGGLSLSGQWWPNKKVGIGIESSFYLLKGSEVAGRKFINFPELNDDITYSEITELTTPVGLFVIYKL